MHDVLIKNGFVLDGTGSPQFLADIAIKDGKIVTIGSVDEASAANIIDASDKFVSPGFIDSHGHCLSQVLVGTDSFSLES